MAAGATEPTALHMADGDHTELAGANHPPIQLHCCMHSLLQDAAAAEWSNEWQG